MKIKIAKILYNRKKRDFIILYFIVPTFDTKVTEYLCSGWFFFFRQISTF